MQRKTLCHPPQFSKTFTDWSKVPVVLSMSDVCCILRVTDDTVRKMLLRGELKGRKSGGSWFIDKDNLKEFLQGK